MKPHRNQSRYPQTELWKGEWNDHSQEQSFVVIPQAFLQHLTPDQYRSQLQVYQYAYQLAVRQIQREEQEAGFYEFGEGI